MESRIVLALIIFFSGSLGLGFDTDRTLKPGTLIYPYPFTPSEKGEPLPNYSKPEAFDVQLGEDKRAPKMYEQELLNKWQTINYLEEGRLTQGWVKKETIEPVGAWYYQAYDWFRRKDDKYFSPPEPIEILNEESNISCTPTVDFLYSIHNLVAINELGAEKQCENYEKEFNSIDKTQRGIFTSADKVQHLKPKEDLEKYVDANIESFLRINHKYKEENARRIAAKKKRKAIFTSKDLYHNEYKHYITNSAKAFKIPNSLLTCMFFRESEYFTGKTSPTGARGVGQFTADTIKDMGKQLKRTPEAELRRLDENIKEKGDRLKAKENRLSGVIKKSREEKEKRQKGREKNKKRDIKEIDKKIKKLEKKLTNMTKKNEVIMTNYKRKVYARNIRPEEELMEAQQGLPRYLQLRDSHRICEALTNEKDGNYLKETIYDPNKEFTSFDKKDAINDAEKSIVMGSFYLKHLQERFKTRFEDAGATDATTQFLMATIAYNMGAGNFEKIWEKYVNNPKADPPVNNKINSLKDVRFILEKCYKDQTIKGNKCNESSNHLDAIKNCSEKGNNTKMDATNWNSYNSAL